MSTLVIVESPAKAHTIGKFLGKDYTVMASIGHVRDLPEHGLAIKIDPLPQGFRFDETYEISDDKKRIVADLAAAARKADTILLASDPDREGEAIAWHLDTVLRERLGKDAAKKTIRRISYNEITKAAVTRAIENPRDIYTDLVNAQRYRRILDRLVGWKVSPTLRNAGVPAAVARTLSAGRVQSVALRMVCERDAAIAAFVPESYWKYTVDVHKASGDTAPFRVLLQKLDGDKADVRDEATHQKVMDLLEHADYRVSDLSTETKQRHAGAPFTTSQLQQAANTALHLAPSRTMALAQQLYQEGLITYMRTDGHGVAKEAQAAAAAFIDAEYGEGFAAPKSFENKASAQGAHEGIRPTDPARKPGDPALAAIDARDRADAEKLYKLIWTRFITSQMKPAEYSLATARVEATRSPHSPLSTPNSGFASAALSATVSTLLFPGFLKATPERLKDVYDATGKEADADDRDALSALPAGLAAGDPLVRDAVAPACKQTKPPAHFNEASLIKAMEEEGIGRPSTYAATIFTIKERKYVVSKARVLTATDLGRKVVDFLVKVDAKAGHGLFYTAYTREMEAELDKVAHEWQDENAVDAPAEDIDWQAGLSDFYANLLAWLDATHSYVPADAFRAVLDKFREVTVWTPPRKEEKRTYDDLKTVQDMANDFMGIERVRGKKAEPGAAYAFDASRGPAESFKGTLPQLRYLLSILARYESQVSGLAAFGDALEASVYPGRDDEEAVAARRAIHEVFHKPEADPAIEAVIAALEEGGVPERDRTFYESLRDQVRRGRTLSPRQTPYLFRIFHAAGQTGLVKGYGPDLCAAIGVPWAEPEKIDREEVAALVDALAKVAEWEAPVTRRGHTFDDHAFSDSVAEQFRTGTAAISAKQVQALEKMVARYAAQIPDAPALMERYHIAAAKRAAGASRRSAAKREGDVANAPAQTLSPELLEKATAILAELQKVEKWNPARKFRGRTYDDAKFVPDVAKKFEKSHFLSDKQLAALEKTLLRYKDQLPGAQALIEKYGLQPAE